MNLKHVPAILGHRGLAREPEPERVAFLQPKAPGRLQGLAESSVGSRNPYTGISLAQDPAVAVIQLQNEDSLLFWTEQSIKGKQLELLGKQFAEWAKQKYGTLETALREWNGRGQPEDDPARGVLGIQIIWNLTQPRSGGVKKRLDDQLQFFAETMYRFNKEMARYLREDLGCKQLINAGNWKTANSMRLYRCRALVVHRQRGDGSQPLLQPRPHRAPRGAGASTKAIGFRTFRSCSIPGPSRLRHEAGSGLSHDDHRDTLGVAPGISVGGALFGSARISRSLAWMSSAGWRRAERMVEPITSQWDAALRLSGPLPRR